MVGGVSIGAFMGALWCQERNITTVTQKAREWSKVTSFIIDNDIILNHGLILIIENDSMVAANFRLNLSDDVNV